MQIHTNIQAIKTYKYVTYRSLYLTLKRLQKTFTKKTFFFKKKITENVNYTKKHILV